MAGDSFVRRLFRHRRTAAVDPRAPALACLSDTDLILRLFRRGAVAGIPEVIELPKLLLEIVRTLVMTDGAVACSVEVGGARRGLWAQLHRVESSRTGDPHLDQALAELFESWDRYRTVVTGALAVAAEDIGSTSVGTPRTHPARVAPYLNRPLPCVGLVDAAADAFATSMR